MLMSPCSSNHQECIDSTGDIILSRQPTWDSWAKCCCWGHHTKLLCKGCATRWALSQILAPGEVNQILELAAGAALSHSRTLDRYCSHWTRRLPWSSSFPYGYETVGQVFYLRTIWWFWNIICRIKKVCFLQYSLPLAHTLLAFLNREGKGLDQQLEITCSHNSLATTVLIMVPEVDRRNSFFTRWSKAVSSYRSIIPVISSFSTKIAK